MKQRGPRRQPKSLGGYAFTLEAGNAKRLYVGTYRVGEPKPRFRISLEPADQEAIVHKEIVTEPKDGHYTVHYYFENYGMTTVRVRMERVRS